jgi:hypothetical protein
MDDKIGPRQNRSSKDTAAAKRLGFKEHRQIGSSAWWSVAWLDRNMHSHEPVSRDCL